MWNRLEVSRARDPDDVGVYHAKSSAGAGYACFGNRTKWRLMGAVLLLFRWLSNVSIQNFDMWGGVYDMAQTDSSLLNPVPIAELRLAELQCRIKI